MTAQARSSEAENQSALWFLAATALIIGGVALCVIRYHASNPGPEGWLASIAFAAPIVVAGCLATIGLACRSSVLLFASSGAVIPMAWVSVLMWPLLVPALLLLIHATSFRTQPSPLEIGLGVVVAIGLIASFVALLVHQDPVSWQSNGSSGSSSDMITHTEAFISFGILAAASVMAFMLLAVERRGDQTPPRAEH